MGSWGVEAKEGGAGRRLHRDPVFVKEARSEIRPVGPLDSPSLGVEERLPEKLGISQRLEDLTPHLVSEVDVFDGVVIEPESDAGRTHAFDGCNVKKHVGDH